MIHIGAVGFLNARPLAYGLDRDLRVSLRLDLPSVCAQLLHAGEIDVGLVPVIEMLRGPVTYDLVPGLAIACEGAVNSVALFTRVALPTIRRVALDVSSRSSVALVRVLCRHHWHIEPEFVDAEPDLSSMLDRADAALMIGDPALDAPWRSLGATKIDLGEAWHAFTGLPFVFAAWIARAGVVTPGLTELLHAAARAGQDAIPTLSQAEAAGDPARAHSLERYLRQNIRYDLDEPALRGLSRYFTLAMQDGLAPARPDVLEAVRAAVAARRRTTQAGALASEGA